jgi:hypothetical protein
MKRGVLTGASIVAASLSFAACSPVSFEGAPAANISLDNLASGLPHAVQEEEGTVLAVDQEYAAISGSAVRVERNLYLTAGHILMTGSNKPRPGSNICTNTIINGPGEKPSPVHDPTGTKSVEIYGSNLTVTGYDGSFKTGDNGSTPDSALLYAPDNGSSLPSQPSANLATSRPKIGSSVYFVNYEPTASNLTRNPNQAMVYDQPGSPINKYDKPAIYGGVLMGYLSNGDEIIADGIKNYGVVPDTKSRKGASGGAAFNSSGQLIGISIESSIGNVPLTQNNLSTENNFSIIGGANTHLPFTVVQPMNQSLIDSMRTRLNSLPDCSSKILSFVPHL